MATKHKGRLTPEVVKQIRREWLMIPRPSVEQLGKKYNVSVSTIEAVLKHKTWKYVEG